MSAARPSLSLLRDICAVTTVALFLFPIAWTALDSLKPAHALYDKDGVVFAFTPTFANYATVFGGGAGVFDGRQSMLSSLLVALGATLLGLALALPAAYALWRLTPRFGRLAAAALWASWMLPPIVLLWPLTRLYHALGLFDTHTGLILAQAALHLPFAILVLTSFLRDVPRESAEAAAIDGAKQWQIFASIAVPEIRGGIAVTAILFFIFCWTEFLLGLFLSAFLRLVPVQAANMNTALGGSTMAFSTAALVPCFIFVLLAQKHLARGLTLGLRP